jgi:hypothetical protein
MIKADQVLSGITIINSIQTLVDENNKLAFDAKEKTEKIETLREKINEIHKKNEK